MYEFTFLTSDRGENFINHLKTLGITATSRVDPINESVTNVAIPDDIDDNLLDQIEAWYEEETSRNEAAARALEDDGDIVSAGIWVQLEDGGSSLARVDPSIMNRILTVLTPDELGHFVSVIADAVEHPDVTPICHNKSTSSCG
ncbi:hypothetical protein [Halothiobacillus sp. 15-55-196]|uniref:hypothetical protein n=1 Tax=Halothiobacillus sp. 15-55-196 TaxID=1970382 RepID=UPI0025BA6C3C|nr:hypothetical protein [Halothiobacillus sp. 15-55-196]